MSTFLAILMQCVAASGGAATAPARADLPVTFARAGEKASVPQAARNAPEQPLALEAFGRRWTPPAAVEKDGTASITVPAVRVPTVFVAAGAESHAPLAEVVAYPAPTARAAKEDRLLIYTRRAPQWFGQWFHAAAISGSCTELKSDEDVPTPANRPKGSRVLMVVGRDGAGEDVSALLTWARRVKANVLVLEMKSMAAVPGAVTVLPRMLTGPLAPMSAQRWARQPRFSFYRAAAPYIANRWPLVLTDDRHALLQACGKLGSGPWVLISSLPWQEQLGRCSEADTLLSAVLNAAADYSSPQTPLRQGVMIYPGKAEGGALKAMNAKTDVSSRPVGSVFVIDLRGPEARVLASGLVHSAPGAVDPLSQKLKDLPQLGEQDRLLVLGDNPLLDNLKWLRLNREKKCSARSDVAWLPSEAAPGTDENAIMWELTKLGVPLGPPQEQEKKHDD